uniref:PH domain-containing protein n=1 Tax=Meloidogyne floridensis TaxID=298350 RepID=A0A915NCS1_9BILA
MCPLAIRGKEREIFGNIEELYQFHSKIFLSELYSYEQNPEDVGYCFIAWMEKLKELYADYCLNKEENNFLICLPEAISMFSEIREQHNLEPCQDLQSLVIKPVQRITKYHNAYEIVLSIPKLANDRMHLKISEPKRYFKREREFQIFLFESNIVFTKREELSSKKTGYVFKDSMLLRELHIVEHIEGDNTKFGLRKSAFPYQNDQNTTVLKANTEAQRILWVKTLRDLKMDIGRHKTGGGGSNTESNRGSRDSQSSLILQSVVASTTLAQLPLEDASLSYQSIDSGHNSLLYSSNGGGMGGGGQQQQGVIMREIIKNEEKEENGGQQQQQQQLNYGGGYENYNNNNSNNYVE